MRKVILTAVCLAATFIFVSQADAGRLRLFRFGGCADPCVSSRCGDCRQCDPLDPGPMQAMKIVLIPKYVTENRAVCVTEYHKETRQRSYTVYKTIPVEEERIATSIEWVPKKETKTIEYSVMVPSRTNLTREFVKTVPVWSEERVAYDVKIPVLKTIDEKYTVKVPVLRDVDFTYTVQVPYPITQQVHRTVTNVIPVTKVRTIETCVPETRHKTVKKDYGRWENQVAEVPYTNGKTRLVTKRVWVANIVEEQIPVLVKSHKKQQIKYTAYEQRTEKIPYDCTYICYKPEERTATRKKVVYQTQVRTRPRQVVEYVSEPRFRIKKVLQFREEMKPTTFPVVKYEKEIRTKEVTYSVKVPQPRTRIYTVTRYDRVPEEKIENYTVRVPVQIVKDVKVQVCKMVPRVVTVNINPCGGCSRGCGGHY